eukprot:1081244-Karenia_brevis.AAC.1
MFSCNRWGPPSLEADPIRWTERSRNKEADFLANHAMDAKQDFHYICEAGMVDWETANLRIWTDGGNR